MTKLIQIDILANEAEKRGFRVSRHAHGVEMWAPEHSGPATIYNWDSCYSTAEFILSDHPSGGYGYNPFFSGPWHDGYCQPDAYGVRKLLDHPAMDGVNL